MTEIKCSACGITGIHACLGKPVVTNDLMLIQTLSKRIVELESDNKALIREGDELDKRWLARDIRIAELEKANTLAVCSLKVGGKMNQILTAKVAELEKIGLELVSIIECHHDSAYCDVFDYEELKAAKEALKEQGK